MPLALSPAGLFAVQWGRGGAILVSDGETSIARTRATHSR